MHKMIITHITLKNDFLGDITLFLKKKENLVLKRNKDTTVMLDSL